MLRFTRLHTRLTCLGLATALATSCQLILAVGADAAEPPIGIVSAADAIQSVRQARKEGRFDEAVKQLVELHNSTKADLSVECVLLARAAGEKLSDTDLSLLLDATEEGLARSQPTKQDLDNRLLVRLSLASSFLKGAEVDRAGSVLRNGVREIEAIGGDLETPNAAATVKLTLQVAYRLLSDHEAVGSEATYEAIVDLLGTTRTLSKSSEADLALAMLGLGWATALQKERVIDASDRLARFVDRFPAHGDAPRAAAYRIQCLHQIGHQSGDVDAVKAASERFLKRWPDDPQAVEVARVAIDSSETPGKALDSWIAGRTSQQGKQVQVSTQYLAKFANTLKSDSVRRIADSICEVDTKGQGTADLLAALEAAGKSDAAIEILRGLFETSSHEHPPMAIEAGGRWAARAGLWSELADAAELLTGQLDDENEPFPSHNLTDHTVRLLAEALTQTGNGSEALAWWEYLVDTRDSRDFPTLLRCAEIAVAQDNVAGARDRVARLKRQLDADDDAQSRGYWVDLLEADLAIRSIDFARARSLFESVVRSPHASPAVQGRAQWMIGETFFMQKDFANAINAYRLVDGIDSTGAYGAAALVQAGKSFEQLGRTQEAGICYGTLLSRFSDSPHASEAHRRMAALAVEIGTETSGTDALKR